MKLQTKLNNIKRNVINVVERAKIMRYVFVISFLKLILM